MQPVIVFDLAPLDSYHEAHGKNVAGLAEKAATYAQMWDMPNLHAKQENE